jgi:FkbM family methyltransferase
MRLALIPRRLLEAMMLEVSSIRTPHCGFPYALRKWKSFLTNSRKILFLGSDYFYEDVFQPFSLFNYINEILYLEKVFGFKGGRVLDIGANIGNFGYVLLNLFPISEVFSFEPNKIPFAYLKRNSNGFSKWHTFNFGVARNASTVDFYFVPGKTGQGSIYKENASINMLKDMPAVRANAYLRPLQKEFLANECGGTYFDLVKIDVEGAEEQVIEGLADIDWKFMYVELSYQRKGAISTDAILSLVKKTHSRPKIIKMVDSSAFKELYILNEVMMTE